MRIDWDDIIMGIIYLLTGFLILACLLCLGYPIYAHYQEKKYEDYFTVNRECLRSEDEWVTTVYYSNNTPIINGYWDTVCKEEKSDTIWKQPKEEYYKIRNKNNGNKKR